MGAEMDRRPPHAHKPRSLSCGENSFSRAVQTSTHCQPSRALIENNNRVPIIEIICSVAPVGDGDLFRCMYSGMAIFPRKDGSIADEFESSYINSSQQCQSFLQSEIQGSIDPSRTESTVFSGVGKR